MIGKKPANALKNFLKIKWFEQAYIVTLGNSGLAKVSLKQDGNGLTLQASFVGSIEILVQSR